MKLTDKEFFSAIKRLKSNKFGGLQLITNDMLKAGQNILAPSLLKLFNSIVSSGFYLDHWSTGYQPYFQVWRSIKTRELQRHSHNRMSWKVTKLYIK